jgi:hypothetical protein
MTKNKEIKLTEQQFVALVKKMVKESVQKAKKQLPVQKEGKKLSIDELRKMIRESLNEVIQDSKKKAVTKATPKGK